MEMRQVIGNALGMVNDLTFATTFEVGFHCCYLYCADNTFTNSFSSYRHVQAGQATPMNRNEVLHLPTVLARAIANVHSVEQKVVRPYIVVVEISNIYTTL